MPALIARAPMALLVGLAACAGSGLGPGPGDGGTADLAAPVDMTATHVDAGRAPRNHRADDSQCLGPAPAGNCTFNGGSQMCHADADCTAGTDGRCVEFAAGIPACICSYDTCASDAACPSGQVCACHGSPYLGGGNTCVAGNCRVDADCGPGGYCSPSPSTMGCGGLGGYFCHTPKDQCLDDSDCTGNMGPLQCSWSPSEARWQCTQVLLCG